MASLIGDVYEDAIKAFENMEDALKDAVICKWREQILARIVKEQKEMADEQHHSA